MTYKEKFDDAYEMLCDKLYLAGGMSYKDIKGSGEEAEKIKNDLIECKKKIDGGLIGLYRKIYRELKIEYDKKMDNWY